MTVEEKRSVIKKYCAGRECESDKCVVCRVAIEDYETGITDAEICYGTDSEELLDKRIVAIEAEAKSEIRRSKISQCIDLCENRITCEGCPCATIADRKHDSNCEFDNFTEEDLDEYIKAFNNERCEKDLATTRSLKIRRLNDLCGDQAEVCPECPCRDLAKEAGTATLCCFEDMDDAMLDTYLAKFSDAATLSETATLSGGGCSGHKVAPPTETSLKDAIHPHHYKLPCGMQVVDVEVAMFGREAVMAHCLCTAAEYILRSQQKNGVEDIKKAHWWLCEYLELEAEGHGK